MKLDWPQITYMVWFSTILLYASHMHGRAPSRMEISFWVVFVRATLITTLIYFGGFFTK